MVHQARNPLLIRTAAAAAIACGLACSQAAEQAPPARTLSQQMSGMSDAERLVFLRGKEKSDPRDATVAFQLGNTYYSLGSAANADQDLAKAYYDSAVGEYQRAVGLDSTYSKAYVNMGLAYDAAGRKPDARRVLQTAVRVNPQDVLAHCHLGQLEQSYGNYADAVKLYRRALEIDPNSAQAHYNLGLAFAETKVFREAMVEWERVIALDPNGELGKTAAENVRMIRQYVDAKPTEP